MLAELRQAAFDRSQIRKPCFGRIEFPDQLGDPILQLRGSRWTFVGGLDALELVAERLQHGFEPDRLRPTGCDPRGFQRVGDARNALLQREQQVAGGGAKTFEFF